MCELDRPVTDRLLLRTVPGAVDYLAEELRGLPEVTVVERRRDGIVVDVTGSLRRLAAVRYFSSAAIVLGDDPVAGLRASDIGVALPGPVRFRVGQLGDVRWPVRDALIAHGWHNEPGDWDLNIERDGGYVAEVGALYWTRRFGALLRAPASTNPVIASAMVRLAKIEPGQTVLDPVCGAGTLLVTVATTVDGVRMAGADHDRRWVRATRDNLASPAAASGSESSLVDPARCSPDTGLVAAEPSPGIDARVAPEADRDDPADRDAAARWPKAGGDDAGGHSAVLWRGDARRLPLADGAIDRVVANLPFGKRVGSHIGNTQLYPALLTELARVLTPKGRAVLLTEDKRLFKETVQRTRGVRVVKEITFATGGAHPSAYVVTTRRTR